MTPRLALTEAAIRLVRHAATDIPTQAAVALPPGRVLRNALGASTDPRDWLMEAALLRLVSIIEAYVDAVSMFRMGLVVDSSHVLVARMLEDFEVGSSSTWQQRHDSYTAYHKFSLKSRAGWDVVSAGIEVRNCLAHGLGNLTAKQRTKTGLPTAVSRINVTVGSNRMHLSATTVPTLGRGCDDFVRDVDRDLDLINP